MEEFSEDNGDDTPPPDSLLEEHQLAQEPR